MSGPLLSLAQVSIAFGGLRAVQGVSLEVRAGTLSALIGPNGAGKTTLFALMSGFLRPDSGQVRFGGQDVTGREPHLNALDGMTRTFQIVQPFAQQTVRENIAVGCHLRVPGRRAALAAAEAVALQVGLAPQLDKPAGDLTVAGRKRLELARALATGPRVLLLDEVAGGLVEHETAALVDLINDVRATGISIIWIEHIVHALIAVVDRLVVLHGGALIAEGEPAEVLRRPQVNEIYMGIEERRMGTDV